MHTRDPFTYLLFELNWNSMRMVSSNDLCYFHFHINQIIITQSAGYMVKLMLPKHHIVCFITFIIDF